MEYDDSEDDFDEKELKDSDDDEPLEEEEESVEEANNTSQNTSKQSLEIRRNLESYLEEKQIKKELDYFDDDFFEDEDLEE